MHAISTVPLSKKQKEIKARYKTQKKYIRRFDSRGVYAITHDLTSQGKKFAEEFGFATPLATV